MPETIGFVKKDAKRYRVLLSRGVKGSDYGRYGGDLGKLAVGPSSLEGQVEVRLWVQGLTNAVRLTGNKDSLLQLLGDLQTEVQQCDPLGTR